MNVDKRSRVTTRSYWLSGSALGVLHLNEAVDLVDDGIRLFDMTGANEVHLSLTSLSGSLTRADAVT